MRLPIAFLLPVALVVALGGCASVRKGLGEYQKAADKGVGLNTGASAEAAPEAQTKKGKKPELPSGLGGDAAHPAYTSTPG